jgi:hypothetical protein
LGRTAVLATVWPAVWAGLLDPLVLGCQGGGGDHRNTHRAHQSPS